MMRDEFADLGALNITRWLELCRDLKSHGVLGPFDCVLRESAPTAIAAVLDREREARREQAQRRARALAAFADEARKERLRFLVVKGMAASIALYGDASARVSGDIDLLVHPDDVPKADYVARKAGFIQPAEAYLIRRACNERGGIDERGLKALESPYALRSNEFLPHFTNYYVSNGDGSTESIEIHDRFHLLPPDCMGDLLWMSRTADFGFGPVVIADDVLGAVISALSLHDDAEGVRANTVARGDMGVKSCVDLRAWMRKLECEGKLDDFAELMDSLGIRDAVSLALGDLVELFPGDAPLVEEIGAPPMRRWPLPYLERAFSPDRRADSGASHALRAAYARLVGRDLFATDGAVRHLCAPSGAGRSPFAGSAVLGDGVARVDWRVPPDVACLASDMVFQCVALGSCDGAVVARRVNVFHEVDSGWTSDVTDVGAGTVITNANRLVHGFPIPISYSRQDDGSCDISCEIPFFDGAREVRAVLSVHYSIVGQLYRRCAGPDFVELLERAIAG